MTQYEFSFGMDNSTRRAIQQKRSITLAYGQILASQQKPWRNSYKQALQAIEKYFSNKISSTEFLHHLRFVAYGLGKRDYNDKQVVWWGNMTEKHLPKLVVQNLGQKFTIHFQFQKMEEAEQRDRDGQWKAIIEKGKAQFHWEL